MNAQSEDTASVLDIVKLVLSAVAIIGGIWAFNHFAEVQLIYRVIALLFVIAVSALAFFTTTKGHTVWGFILESKQEAKRVVWPTRDEAFRTTAMVVVMVVIVGFLLWLIDLALFQLIEALMGMGIS